MHVCSMLGGRGVCSEMQQTVLLTLIMQLDTVKFLQDKAATQQKKELSMHRAKGCLQVGWPHPLGSCRLKLHTT